MTQIQSDTEASIAEAQLLTPSAALGRMQADAIEISAEQHDAFAQIRYGFSLGSVGVLTPTDMVCEVMDVQQICPVPNTSGWFAGLVNLRGNLVPVFDLGRMLNVEDNTRTENKQWEEHNMFVIGSGDKSVALIIDGLPQPITDERQETQLPPIAEYAKSFVSKAYSFKQRIWIDLDLEAYLLSMRAQLAAA